MLGNEGVDQADDGLLVFLAHVFERLEAAEQPDAGEVGLFGLGAGEQIVHRRIERGSEPDEDIGRRELR